LLLHRVFWGKNGSASDYLKVDGEFYSFEKGKDDKTQQAALNTLTALLNSHPDLQSKYDALIAQTLINRGAIKEALPFAERTLARTGKDHLTFYSDFAHTTLLMSEQNYPEALKKAQDLKEKMIAEGKEPAQVRE